MGHGRIWQPTSFPFFLFSCPSSFQFRLSTWRGGVLRGPLSEWREEETLGTSGILWREKLTSRPLTALRLWRRWRHGMMFLFFFFAYSLTRSVLYISSYFFFPLSVWSTPAVPHRRGGPATPLTDWRLEMTGSASRTQRRTAVRLLFSLFSLPISLSLSRLRAVVYVCTPFWVVAIRPQSLGETNRQWSPPHSR